MKKVIKLVCFLYLFVLSIELIKNVSLLIAPDIKGFLLQNLTPIKAVCVGWFTTSVVQSSGAVSSVVATFVGSNLININLAVYILMGALFGTSITALIISLVISSKQSKDFRHGFEIGLCLSIYSALLVLIIFSLEYLFGIYSKTAIFLSSLIYKKAFLLAFPDIIKFITSPIINLVLEKNNKYLVLLVGFIGLIIALRYIGKSVIDFFGGEHKAREFINKYFDSKYKAYFIGVGLTAILFSSSITIGLLVPLAVSRIINLRKAIPFILGANLGTFTDLVLVSLIIGKASAFAVPILTVLFGITGGIIFLPNTKFLHDTTKFISKKLINISREKAFYILIGFVLIPLIIIFVF